MRVGASACVRTFRPLVREERVQEEARAPHGVRVHDVPPRAQRRLRGGPACPREVLGLGLALGLGLGLGLGGVKVVW